MQSLSLREIRKILFLGAHADDIEIGAGATILRWQNEYPDAQIRWVVFSGSESRQAEARSSAEAFLKGYTAEPEIELVSFRDSYFPAQFSDIKQKLQSIAAEYSPDVVFTHFNGDGHQDHRLLCELTHNAFRDHLILEYEIPKYDADLGNPNVFVPVSQETAEKKIATLMACFSSQRDKPWFCERTFWATLALRGIQSKAESGLAEGFYCRKLVL